MKNKPTPPRYGGTASPRPDTSTTVEIGHFAWLHIAYSGRYPFASADIDRRLTEGLRGTGVICWFCEQSVLLMGEGRLITPTDWSAVIGWLLRQPEVVFVARVFPVSRRRHEQAH